METNQTVEMLMNATYEQALELYKSVLVRGDNNEIRWMCQNDRFFLLVCALERQDAVNKWIYERCREVEREPEGFLDLWSRFHYKSTIITLAGAIQEILKNPEITIGIFSHVLSLSKKFVRQIQRSLESKRLYDIFPDILHERPPQRFWSVQDGLVVKRKSNPKEPTVQAAGLVDGQPTGAHYMLRIYDDIVTAESVATPDQILKTTDAWELSLALGTLNGGRAWYCGTRYHPDDTYQELISRGVLKERRRICYDKNGKAVLMKQKALDKLRKEMGERTFASQMLQIPISSGVRTFNDTWFQQFEKMPDPKRMNRFIIVDPAKSKPTKRNPDPDFTVMWVVGLHMDKNYYILDGIRDRLNLAERTRELFKLVAKWEPLATLYEQQGLAADVEHIKLEQAKIGWNFQIVPLSQTVPKYARIEWLVPIFEQAKMWFPQSLLKQSVNAEPYCVTQKFLEEYKFHPICKHDDMLDALANIGHPVAKEFLVFPYADSSIMGMFDTPPKTVNNRRKFI